MALSGWSIQNKIAVAIPAQSSALTNFPILLNIGSSSGTNGLDLTSVFDELGSSSLKIAVENGDTGSECYVEIERWDDTNEEAQIRVKAPSISSSATTILNFYFDSSHADNSTYVGNIGDAVAQTVWGSNFKAVWHLSQDPTAGGACILDSTSNANHGTPVGSLTASSPADADVGKCLYFDGDGDYISCGDDSSLECSSFTVTAAVKCATSPASSTGRIVAKGSTAAGDERNYYLFLNEATNTFTALLENTASDVFSADIVTSDVKAWNHFYGTGNQSANTVHAGDDDGNSDFDSFTGTIATVSGSDCCIGRISGDPVAGFEGWIRTITISDTVRSSAWTDAFALSEADDLCSVSISTIQITGIIGVDSTVYRPLAISGGIGVYARMTANVYAPDVTVSGIIGIGASGHQFNQEQPSGLRVV